MQYKQQSRLDEKRKKALDMHLSFIVDQTEKYSTWLTEGLASGPTMSTAPGSELQSAPASVQADSSCQSPSVDQDG